MVLDQFVEFENFSISLWQALDPLMKSSDVWRDFASGKKQSSEVSSFDFFRRGVSKEEQKQFLLEYQDSIRYKVPVVDRFLEDFFKDRESFLFLSDEARRWEFTKQDRDFVSFEGLVSAFEGYFSSGSTELSPFFKSYRENIQRDSHAEFLSSYLDPRSDYGVLGIFNISGRHIFPELKIREFSGLYDPYYGIKTIDSLDVLPHFTNAHEIGHFYFKQFMDKGSFLKPILSDDFWTKKDFTLEYYDYLNECFADCFAYLSLSKDLKQTDLAQSLSSMRSVSCFYSKSLLYYTSPVLEAAKRIPDFQTEGKSLSEIALVTFKVMKTSVLSQGQFTEMSSDLSTRFGQTSYLGESVPVIQSLLRQSSGKYSSFYKQWANEFDRFSCPRDQISQERRSFSWITKMLESTETSLERLLILKDVLHFSSLMETMIESSGKSHPLRESSLKMYQAASQYCIQYASKETGFGVPEISKLAETIPELQSIRMSLRLLDFLAESKRATMTGSSGKIFDQARERVLMDVFSVRSARTVDEKQVSLQTLQKSLRQALIASKTLLIEKNSSLFLVKSADYR